MNQGLQGSAKSLSALIPHWLVVLSLVVTCCSRGQDNDPSAMWYRAFLTYESTLELEKKGEFLQALNKCNEAMALYKGLSYNYPQFQPDIVKFKQKVVADTKSRIMESNRIKNRGGNPNQPPNIRRPSQGSTQQIPQQGELPNVQIPGPYEPNTPIQQSPPQTWGGKNLMPSWNQNRRVSGAANDLLNQVKSESQRKDSIIRELNEENLKLKSELDATRSRLQSAEANLAQSRRKEQEYKRQLAAYERDPSGHGLAQKYKAMVKEVMADYKEQIEVNGQLLARIRQQESTIRRQSETIKALEAERDSLARVIEGKEVGSEALSDLMEQNKRLSERLVLLEKVAQRTSNDIRQKEQDIALLKSEVEKVRVERERLVAENVKHQQEIAGLQKKLQMLSDGLSESDRKALANMAPEQKAENELLRSMVVKQLQRQAHLKHSKDLLLRQLERVGARSEALMEVVEDMARGPQLSPAEKELFRSPQMQELIADAAPMHKEPLDGTLRAPARPGAGDMIPQKVEVELSQLDKASRLDFKEGRYSEAEQGFLKYLHFRPRSVPCLCNLGVLKLAMSDYGAAQHYLQKAVAIDKSSGQAFYLLGRTYFLQEKMDDALSHLEQGIHLQPNNEKAHNCVGVIASKKGWVARAEKAFIRAVKLKPDFGDAHFNLAVLFSTKGQHDFRKAKTHYFEAIRLGVPRDAVIEGYLKQAAGIEVGLR